MPMPTGLAEQENYRSESGSSFAIRINPLKTDVNFDLKKALRQHIYGSEVSVFYDDEEINSRFADLFSNPWLKNDTLIELDVVDEIKEHCLNNSSYLDELSERDRRSLYRDPEGDDLDLPNKVYLRVLPIDLARHSMTPDFKGQLVEFSLKVEDGDGPFQDRFSLNLDEETGELTAKLDLLKNMWQTSYDALEVNIGYFFDFIGKETKEIIREHPVDFRRSSHNGISFLMKDGVGVFNSPYTTNYKKAALGMLKFKDEFRPTIGVSRDEKAQLDWKIVSAVMLAYWRATGEENLKISNHDAGKFLRKALGYFLQDPLLIQQDAWQAEEIFNLRHKADSIRGILTQTGDGSKVELMGLDPRHGFGTTLVEVVQTVFLQTHLECEVRFNGWRPALYVVGPTEISPEDKNFPPLFFVPYVGKDVLYMRRGVGLNRSHPFSIWFRENSIALTSEYPSIFETLFSETYEWISSYELTTNFDIVNAALSRLREVGASCAPPSNLKITGTDFGDE